MCAASMAERNNVCNSFFTLAERDHSDEAEEAIRTIHSLRVEIINEDEELSLRALELAGKLGNPKPRMPFIWHWRKSWLRNFGRWKNVSSIGVEKI